jgi:transcriptional regulator with XRE-family HTH domain
MNKIKQELERQQLTQKWLAEKLHTTPVSVNSWCQNKSQPSIQKLYKVALVLKTKPSKLLVD